MNIIRQNLRKVGSGITRVIQPHPVELQEIQGKAGRLHYLDPHARTYRELHAGSEAHVAHHALALTLRQGPGDHLKIRCPIKAETTLVDPKQAREIVLSVFEPNIKKLVYTFSRRRKIVCPEKVEDLTQKARMKVVTKAGLWKGDSAFTTWLHRVVLNVVIDGSRREPQQRRVALETDVDFFAGGFSLDSSRPSASTDTEGDSQIILKSIDKLSPKLREIILLSIQYETLQEMAAALNVPIGTVKSRLSRARTTLVQFLPDAQRAALSKLDEATDKDTP